MAPTTIDSARSHPRRRRHRRRNPGRPAARPHRDPPLRRHGVQVAGALRAPRGRLRRPRPRRVRAGAAPDAYGYDALADDLEAVLDELGDRARGARRRVDGRAHDRRAWRSRAPTASRRPCSSPRRSSPGRDEGWPAGTASPRACARTGSRGSSRRTTSPRIPETWHDTVLRVIRQRLEQHEHLDAVADALQAVPRSQPFGSLDDLGRIALPVDRGRQRRRGRPRASLRRRRALGRGARRRAAAHGGAREVAARLAGRPALQAHRRSRGFRPARCVAFRHVASRTLLGGVQNGASEGSRRSPFRGRS